MHDTRRTRLVLGVLLVAALALITLDARNSSAAPVRGLRAFGGVIFGSAESVASGVTRPVAAFLSNVGTAAHAQATISSLQRRGGPAARRAEPGAGSARPTRPSCSSCCSWPGGAGTGSSRPA